MTKENLLNNINKLIKENNYYHSIILINNKQEILNEIAIEIARQIFCKKNSLINDSCVECKNVINNNNPSYIFLGDGVSKINKESIKDIILKFSLTSIQENKYKVYIIANGENLKEHSANAILKFLEEPPMNTYAIILSKNKNHIIPTILSRSKIFFIENEDDIYYENIELVNLIIQKDKKEILKYLINFKKKDKKEILDILNITLHWSIKNNLLTISEIIVDSLNEIENANYLNLILENLFINIYEVI